MRKHRVLILSVLVLASVILLAGAASAREPIHKRISNQQHRIDQGIASGSLTRSEADVLQDNLDHIRNRFTRAKADGYLTREEEERLQDMLDQNSRMINKKEHNQQVRRIY